MVWAVAASVVCRCAESPSGSLGGVVSRLLVDLGCVQRPAWWLGGVMSRLPGVTWLNEPPGRRHRGGATALQPDV
jgi:hypothetical protein